MHSPDNFPETDPSLAALTRIRERIWEVRTAYYPCSLDDVRLSAAFPEARIVRLDRNFPSNAVTPPGTIDIVGEATTFSCEEAPDLVFLSNPEFWHPNLVRQVKIGGHVIANDYHSTATALSKLTNFRLIGCEALEGKWIESKIAMESLRFVADDQEWQRVSPWSFEKTQKIREALMKKYWAVLWSETGTKSIRDWRIGMQDRIDHIITSINATGESWMGWPMEDYFAAMEMASDFGSLPRVPKKRQRLDDFFVFLRTS